jgi:hypothetical protein
MSTHESSLVGLMQRRAILKKELRDWTRVIKDRYGREPSKEECEKNVPTLTEYAAVKKKIEKLMAQRGEDMPQQSASASTDSSVATIYSPSLAMNWITDVFSAPVVAINAGHFTRRT